MENTAPKRLLSLDIFRGLTVAGMIVVNSPGSDDTYAWAAHAHWHGCTFADLVFPSFLVIMGTSLVISLSRRRERGDSVGRLLSQIFRRSLIIFGLGLIASAVFFGLSPIHYLRIPGVLQRIAVCYFACSLLYLFTSLEVQIGTLAALLLGYWALMMRVPVPGYGRGNLTPAGNLASYLDRRVLGTHMLTGIEDPEGILSTLPAIATSLLGVVAGQWIVSSRPKRRKATLLLAAGLFCAAVGRLWAVTFPLNKQIWTSSFALLTGGIALIGLGACYAFLDENRGWKSCVGRPLEVLGRNPLIAFFASGLFYGLQTFVPISPGKLNLKLWITERFFGAWLSPPDASLAYALAYAALCTGALAILYRKKIFVKI